MQPRFINKSLIRLAILLPLVVVLESDREDWWPTRTPRPPAVAMVEAIPLPIPRNAVGLGGLWELRSSEPRFGGLSGLAWDRGRLLAVTDSGAVVRWPAPGGPAAFRDLPNGPGLPQWKANRDSEAITPDVYGRGWWVSFEQHHGAWLFDREFGRSLGHRPVQLATRWRNWGVEASVSLPSGLLLFPEDGGEAVLLRDDGEERALLRVDGAISDAVVVQDDPVRTIVAVRSVWPWGISNRLGTLDGEADYFVREWGRLPLGRWDNVEGLALEKRPCGKDRLWFVTDNDYRRRTLLGWVALETTKAPAKAEASSR